MGMPTCMPCPCAGRATPRAQSTSWHTRCARTWRARTTRTAAWARAEDREGLSGVFLRKNVMETAARALTENISRLAPLITPPSIKVCLGCCLPVSASPSSTNFWGFSC